MLIILPLYGGSAAQNKRRRKRKKIKRVWDYCSLEVLDVSMVLASMTSWGRSFQSLMVYPLINAPCLIGTTNFYKTTGSSSRLEAYSRVNWSQCCHSSTSRVHRMIVPCVCCASLGYSSASTSTAGWLYNCISFNIVQAWVNDEGVKNVR